MADKKITDLPLLSAIDGADQVEVVDSSTGVSSRVTRDNFGPTIAEVNRLKVTQEAPLNVNWADYDFSPDNSAAQNDTAWNNIIAAVSAGDTILIPEKDTEYLISQKMLVNKAINIQMVGRPTIRQVTAHTPVFDLYDTDDVEMLGKLNCKYSGTRVTTAGNTRNNLTHKFATAIWLGGDRCNLSQLDLLCDNFYSAIQLNGWDSVSGLNALRVGNKLGFIDMTNVSFGVLVSNQDDFDLGDARCQFMRVSGDSDPAHAFYLAGNIGTGAISITNGRIGRWFAYDGPDIADVDSPFKFGECSDITAEMLIADNCAGLFEIRNGSRINAKMRGINIQDNGGNGAGYYNESGTGNSDDNDITVELLDMADGARMFRPLGERNRLHCHKLLSNRPTVTSGAAIDTPSSVINNFTLIIDHYFQKGAGAETLVSCGTGVNGYKIKLGKALGLNRILDQNAAALGVVLDVDPFDVSRPGSPSGAFVVTNAPAQVRHAKRNIKTIAADASNTVTPWLDGEEVLLTGTLTANRTLTLSTTGVAIGSRFHVVRTGGGAFTWDIGGLKTINQNQWVIVVYDGTGWKLFAFGSL